MIEASFQTRLPKAHKLSQDGIYGLQFVLAFADRDKTENKYEQYLPTDSVSTRYKSNQTKLQKLKNKIDEIWQDAKLSLEQKTLKTKAIIKQIQNLVSGNTSIPEKDTVNDLVNGLNQIQTPEDVDKVFDKMEQEYSGKIKYIPYTIDSNSMTGNPFRFSSWSEQYQIFPIDRENFLYIDSILFYEKDFVDKDNTSMISTWGPDIFLKDIEVYPLKKINAVNGNYKLSLSMPQGSTFRGNIFENQLDIVAKVTEKNINNLSDNTTFYWF